MGHQLSLCALVLAVCTTPVTAETYVVNPEGTGDFPTVQAAIEAASDGDIIELTDGTFTGNGNRDIDFLGKAIAVRSLNGDAQQCLIDCMGSHAFPHRGFHFHSGEGSGAVIARIGIFNGRAEDGGAILCSDSSPQVIGCWIFQNTAERGAGIYCTAGAAPIFRECTVSGNHADIRGGGLFCDAHATPMLIEGTLHGNGAPSGGGSACIDLATLDLENTIIAFSTAGEAVFVDEGGSVGLVCSDLFGNDGGDWVGGIAEQLGQDGNICEDPRFCDPTDDDFGLLYDSPCTAESNPDCGQIGAWPMGCRATYVVWPDGTGDFPTIAAAITASQDGDVVGLGDGVFTGEGNRDLQFGGKDITVRSLSGDAEACVIDCQASPGDPHRGFHLCWYEGPTAVIQAIAIRNGRSEYQDPFIWTAFGGGILLRRAASPTIIDCVIEGNHAEELGGGVCCIDGGTPRLVRCTFRDNGSESCGGGLAGLGGDDIPSIEMQDCVVTDNAAQDHGGGMFLQVAGATVDGCTFAGNTATFYGGGFTGWDAWVSVTDCCFATNTAVRGGALYLEHCWSVPGPGIEGTVFEQNEASLGGGICIWDADGTVVRECTLWDNIGYSSGGAIYACIAELELWNCSLVSNRAPTGGGVFAGTGCSVLIGSSLVAFGTEGEAVLCAEGDATLACCDLYGNEGGDWIEPIAEQYGVDGNICEDPLFCDAPNGDFTLREDSPCAPGSPPNAECDLTGAWPVGCTAGGILPAEIRCPSLRLDPNSPNPFRMRTTLTFELPGSHPREVVLSVYDAAGRMVRRLLNAEYAPGTHEAVWDGLDTAGRPAPAGVYLVRLQDGGKSASRRIVFVR